MVKAKNNQKKPAQDGVEKAPQSATVSMNTSIVKEPTTSVANSNVVTSSSSSTAPSAPPPNRNSTNSNRQQQQQKTQNKTANPGSQNQGNYRGGNDRRSNNSEKQDHSNQSNNRSRDKDKEKSTKGAHANHLGSNGNVSNKNKARELSSQSQRPPNNTHNQSANSQSSTSNTNANSNKDNTSEAHSHKSTAAQPKAVTESATTATSSVSRNSSTPERTTISSVQEPSPAPPAEENNSVVHFESDIKKDESSNTKKESVTEPVILKHENGEDVNTPMLRKIDGGKGDTFLVFKEHNQWDQIDFLCEIINVLTPVDLRLLGNLIEGSCRSYNNQMKPVERSANSENPMHFLPNFQIPHIPPQFRLQTNQDAGYSSASPSSSSTATSLIKENGTAPSALNERQQETRSPQPNGTSTETSEVVSAPIPTTQSNGPSMPTALTAQQNTENFQYFETVFQYVYVLISMCSSTNRRSAAKLAEYVQRSILPAKDNILEVFNDPMDKVAILELIGKISCALLHHPAVEVTHKLHYSEIRDTLRMDIEQIYSNHYKNVMKKKQTFDDTKTLKEYQNVDQKRDANGTSSNNYSEPSNNHKTSYSSHGFSAPIYIVRFIGTLNQNCENSFLIEIVWSDGEHSFVGKTTEDLRSLQHRLLDLFGQQRTEKVQGMNSSISSFDEDLLNKKLSTSTSTMEGHSSGQRILPRLLRDANAAEIVQYINELSDLPARMMMSSVIYEEFYRSRIKSQDVTNDDPDDDTNCDGNIFTRWRNPRPRTPSYDIKTGLTKHPLCLAPFYYSNVPPTHIQVVEPSCSNCGEGHPFSQCPKQTLIERKNDFRLDFESDGSQIPINGMQQMQMAPPGLPPPLNHFGFHQQLQQQQQNPYFNHHQYQRPTPFENGHVYMPPYSSTNPQYNNY